MRVVGENLWNRVPVRTERLMNAAGADIQSEFIERQSVMGGGLWLQSGGETAGRCLRFFASSASSC